MCVRVCVWRIQASVDMWTCMQILTHLKRTDIHASFAGLTLGTIANDTLNAHSLAHWLQRVVLDGGFQLNRLNSAVRDRTPNVYLGVCA